MAANSAKGPNIAHQALSKMSRSFYEKYGEEAIPVISDAWYEMGTKLGAGMKARHSISDFKSASRVLNDNVYKMAQLGGTCQELSESVYHFRTRPGSPCDVGLEGTDHSICNGVMSVNLGYFKAACGIDVDMNIVKCRAAGDDCCEVIYRPK